MLLAVIMSAMVGCKSNNRGPYPSGYEQGWREAKAYAETAIGAKAKDPQLVVHRKAVHAEFGWWVMLSPNGKWAMGWYDPQGWVITMVVAPDGTPDPRWSLIARHEMGHHVLWTTQHIMDHDPRYRKLFLNW